jgi:outer membrane protein
MVGGAGAGTIGAALIEAYRNNPQLNAQRAAVRATDENVPGALSGYRPRVTGTSSLTEVYLDNLTKAGSTPQTGALYNHQRGAIAVSTFGLTATQTLFNGFQTASRTRQAEGQAFAARETLRTTEQSTLLNAATAYMNLL